MELHNYFSDRNKAVLTTSFVFDKEDQITRVYHHIEDGMWEFISERVVKESDYKVISMEEMLNIDESIVYLSAMKPGFYACRKDQNDTFEIKIIEE